ncbi:MAG: hypothetical protein JNK33_02145 [Candidatus Doudnabacteria bacterium]|nr:hypothetical protein [Candidatus Doudnabacteria bacterium]
MHHRTLKLVSVLFVTVKIVALSWLSLGAVQPASSAAITQESVLTLTNQSRKESGVKAVGYSAVLERAAQDKANDMLAKQYFAHNSPDGKTPWDFIKKQGYQYLSAGENLAVHFFDDRSLQEAWMNSPGHRANILNGNFEEMGVGIARGFFENHDTTFVVEMFGLPAEQPIAMQNRPTPVTRTTPSPATDTSLFKKPKPKTAEASAPVQVPTAQAVPSPESSQVTAEPAPVQELKIVETQVKVEEGNLIITSRATPVALRLLLVYGARARFFHPTSNNTWRLVVPIEAVRSETLWVKAFDIQGNKVSAELASLTPTFDERYLSAGSVKGALVSVFGQQFDAQLFEDRMYALVISLLLVSLMIVVAVHRRVFQIQMVANAGFVVVLACALLVM